jgi:hypothetical protein
VFIDWEEDAGTPRDEIAETVKKAMNRSKSFLIVKTEDCDKSSWVPWETGYFDNIDSNKIGVLLVEDENFNHKTFLHREYLKNYALLGPDDIVDFIRDGNSYLNTKYGAQPQVGVPYIVKKPESMVKPHNHA